MSVPVSRLGSDGGSSVYASISDAVKDHDIAPHRRQAEAAQLRKAIREGGKWEGYYWREAFEWEIERLR